VALNHDLLISLTVGFALAKGDDDSSPLTGGRIKQGNLCQWFSALTAYECHWSSI
jgi:hypothetical protein